jgi:hypothetical protein
MKENLDSKAIVQDGTNDEALKRLPGQNVFFAIFLTFKGIQQNSPVVLLKLEKVNPPLCKKNNKGENFQIRNL